MKRVNYDEEFKKEKETLNKLIDEALKKGTSIAQNETILDQSSKVDALIIRLQEEKEKRRHNQSER